MINRRLTLDYTLGAGWLAPWIEGLIGGKAVARRCDSCAKISFPPLRVCDCGASHGEWHSLQGTARIVLRTDGADGHFALVRFDGADTQSVVKLSDVPADCLHGALKAAPGPHPEVIVGPVSGQGTDKETT